MITIGDIGSLADGWYLATISLTRGCKERSQEVYKGPAQIWLKREHGALKLRLADQSWVDYDLSKLIATESFLHRDDCGLRILSMTT